MRSHRSTTLAVLAALLGTLGGASAARAAVTFTPCGPAGAGCATVPVPLDHSGRAPGTLNLAIARIPHGGAGPHGVFLVLAGGPGQAGNPLLGVFQGALGPALTAANLDLVTVDLRGTGASGLLRCAALHSGSGLIADTQGCARELGPNRAFFRTTDSVDDLEALRSALGVDKLTLDGTSYGTKVAEAYAVRYPTHVARLILDSVLAVDGPDSLDRPTLQAVPRVLGDACRVGGCPGRLANPAAKLAAVADGVVHRPLRARFVDRHGRRLRVTLGSGDILGLLLSGDFNPALRADLPAAAGAARRGDSAPLARLVDRAASSPGGSDRPAIRPAAPVGAVAGGRPAAPVGAAPGDASAALENDVVFIDTFCEELPLPWARSLGPLGRLKALDGVLAAQPAGAFGGFPGGIVRGDSLIQHCLFWPGDPPPPSLAGAVPDVPVLTLSGADDLRTPAEEAAGVAGAFPHATRLVAAGTGHAVLANAQTCAAPAIGSFLLGAPQVPAACGLPGVQVRIAPPVPSGLGGLSPLGARGRRGRVARAVLDTVADALREADFYGGPGASATLGGLRAGTLGVSRARLRLRGYTYVSGVAVSGTIGGTGAVVTVAARGTTGRLRIRRGRIIGTLGGAHVSGRFRLANPIVRTAGAATAATARPSVPVPAALRAARWRDDSAWLGVGS